MHLRNSLSSSPLTLLALGLLVVCVGACTTSSDLPDPSPDKVNTTASTTTSAPTAPTNLRIATYNVSFHRSSEGALATELEDASSAQPKAIAEVIQTVRPDVVLLNEFDFDSANRGVELFQANFLATGQNGQQPIQYPHVYVVPANTGVHSGMDLDNNGSIDSTVGSRGYGGDAFGFGTFPGQYAFAVLSKYPIQFRKARSFQKFLWSAMPNALLPDNPNTPEPNDWFSPEELQSVRLSSKNHIDIPIDIDGKILHVLAAHPTPPVFDGPEDRNGKRNHDELRLWADYLSGASYLVDDAGNAGGLEEGAHFAILGDMNADPNDGDSAQNSIQQLLDHPRVNTSKTPTSTGAVAHGKMAGGQNDTHKSPPEHDTASFSPTQAGNLRLDYALPSKTLTLVDAGVFWPNPGTPEADRILGTDPRRPASSDHRMVWIDVQIP